MRASFASTVAIVAATAVVALAAPAAHANGRYPMAQYFLAGHGAAADTLVLKTTFGVVVSDDRGATFRYLCEDALGYGKAVFDPAVALLPDRTLLIGLSNGATHVGADRCTFDPVPTLAGQYIDDFDVDPSGKVVVAATSTGFTDDFNHVWRSEDGGATFTSMGPGVKGTFIVSVEVARTDVSRVWASALQLSPRKVIVYRSDDKGATLVDSSFPYPDSDFAVVSGVDPTDRDTVYVRTEVTTSTGRRTILSRTRDGGATWNDLVESDGEMLGFAIGDVPLRTPGPFPTRQLFMGGPNDGLQRSDDDGKTWTKLASPQVQCLRWNDGVLYVCGSERNDPDAGFVGDHFALADSCDRGDTLHPLLGFLGIAGVVPGCDPSSPEQASCPDRWEGEAGVKYTFPTDDFPAQPLCSLHVDAGADADATETEADAEAETGADADADAGAIEVGVDASNDAANEPTTEGSDSSGGCGCGLVGAASNATWIALVVASTFAAMRARRSKRP